jgi:hypothetical protein
MAKEPKDTSDRMTSYGAPFSAPEPFLGDSVKRDSEGQNIRSPWSLPGSKTRTPRPLGIHRNPYKR